MNNQAQYPQPQQNPSPQPQQEKPLLVQAVNGISVILAIVTSLFVSPFLIRYTQGIFIYFMRPVFGDLGELYEFFWWMVCYLLVGFSALAFFNVKITSKITKSAMRSFE